MGTLTVPSALLANLANGSVAVALDKIVSVSGATVTVFTYPASLLAVGSVGP